MIRSFEEILENLLPWNFNKRCATSPIWTSCKKNEKLFIWVKKSKMSPHKPSQPSLTSHPKRHLFNLLESYQYKAIRSLEELINSTTHHIDLYCKIRRKASEVKGERRQSKERESELFFAIVMPTHTSFLRLVCPSSSHTCEFSWGNFFCYYSPEISRDNQISEIWTTLTYVDYDLLEMDWRRVDLGLCGNHGLGLGSWTSHYDLIL